ncbi:hypothetical protein DEJ27_03085 [Curtobacterium sp. MCPF17_018]|uniref:hypothetical protein n=1 Tax=Curtobacterium sp. MCPF17_018 TaxID=2175638 RepID=UPI000DA7A4C8|nr:hypothetical protein [Curtobacterium sp. MCPF17_018]PZE71775.1 hypothetical protein DEJ27_03085 [Curtobacterium sp. MCPF17_018]
MTDSSSKWLKTYLEELEAAGNKILTQLYEDNEGVPSGVVGAGSISIASYTLASELATLTAHPDQMVQAVVRHHALSTGTLGAEAWSDVLYGALLHLAMLYLEPAYRVTDSSGDLDMRAAANEWWETLQNAAGSDPA